MPSKCYPESLLFLLFFFLKKHLSKKKKGKTDLMEMRFCVLSCLFRALTFTCIQWDFCHVAKRPFSLVTRSHYQLNWACSCLLLWAYHCHPRSAAFYFSSMSDSMWQWQLVLNSEWIIKKTEKAKAQEEKSCLKDSEAHSKPGLVCLFVFNHRWITPTASSHTSPARVGLESWVNAEHFI